MAIKIDPKNPYTYYNRGISYDRKQKYKLAVNDFTLAIKLDKSKADFYYNRGFAFRKL